MELTSFSDDTFRSYPTPCLKPVKIKLNFLHLARKYTPICSFIKYTFWYLGLLNFAYVCIFCKNSAFFARYQRFLAKIVPLLKQ